MSVDLGSEWMKIAIVSPGVPMEIILNTDSQRKTPMAIAFRDGERFVGDAAVNIGTRFPEKTFTHFLDLMGKTKLSSKSVQKYLQQFPYHTIVEKDNQSIAFVLNDNNEEITFTPEELLSMMLAKAKYYAEAASASSSPTGQAQIITDCVITVPPYFSQKERKALKVAADLANLKVLQLINVNTAFGLNYGIFRRKDFNSSNPTNILFYDMGAGSTIATIISYQLVKNKDRGFTEIDPQMIVKGVAYDRYLGGLELQLRLRDHLVKLFSEQSKKTIDEIRKNKKAMAKLLKEAGRLKKVLSANSEHKAQIENVMNDIDLKSIVTREQFEELTQDIINERVTKPLEDVFNLSGYQLAEIDQFIIIGGATRIPKIQKLLEDYWSKELSKNINADEAAALGAAYQAAYLSKGFKVKTFIIKDYNLYQINVDLQRDLEENQKKIVSRTLFGRGNAFPQKKVITFNKNQNDFQFIISYVEPIPQDTEKFISKISLEKVKEVFEKHSNSTTESKGIKVHFRMDESGLLSVENSEALFDIEYEVSTNKDSDLNHISDLVGDAISKFGSKLSNLFSNNEVCSFSAQIFFDSNTAAENTTNTNGTGVSDKENVSKQNKTLDTNDSQSSRTAEESNRTEDNEVHKEIKRKIVKEELITNVENLDGINFSAESIIASKTKLKALNKREMEKLERDRMKNALESFIHETLDKLNQEEYIVAVNDDERQKIETELKTVSEWLDYESDNAKADDYEQKLVKLNGITKDLFERVREHRSRPEMISSLENILNIADMFHLKAINVSETEQIFTEIEMKTLRKLIDETRVWINDSVKEQNVLPKSSPPLLTLANISDRIAAIDREMKYLLNKARITPGKKKTSESSKTSNRTTEKDFPKEDEKNQTIIDSATNETAEEITPEPVVDSAGPSKTEL
ncbi:Sar s 28 (heat shock protein 70-like protein 7) [Sarcoptes scabiei]|uniref:Hypoxia up-regulated protein 1 n=1 Tax=Sarcoptes scabiei TaxID=52283 RepID=A0A132AIN2_SARSC|nr:Sar s 28 (heat shock protein 70-like protein 7) [Sarcoptes scabiei]